MHHVGSIGKDFKVRLHLVLGTLALSPPNTMLVI